MKHCEDKIDDPYLVNLIQNYLELTDFNSSITIHKNERSRYARITMRALLANINYILEPEQYTQKKVLLVGVQDQYHYDLESMVGRYDASKGVLNEIYHLLLLP